MMSAFLLFFWCFIDVFEEHWNKSYDCICSEYAVKEQNNGAKMTVIAKHTKKKSTGVKDPLIVTSDAGNTIETYILKTQTVVTHTVIRTVKIQN